MDENNTQAILIRALRADDIPDALLLSELAGWNQTVDDWRRLIEWEPEGCFAATLDGRLVGSATTTTYGARCGWIGMVLVHPDYRRFGIGTQMLNTGFAYLEERVATVKLDATPAGKLVYDRNGFHAEYEIERWEGIAPTVHGELAPAMPATDLARVIEADIEIFGADRGRLLHSLYSPSTSAVAMRNGAVAGYAFSRPGRLAEYIGPLAAKDAETARQLLEGILARIPGRRVFIDICLANPNARTLMQEYGMRLQRPFTRMYRGRGVSPGRPELVYGIAGPEIG